MKNTHASSDCQAFLKELARLWPLTKGSLAEVAKSCGRPACGACQRGTRHRAYLYTVTQRGQRRCLYVPEDLVPVLRQALANGRRLQERLADLGVALVEGRRRDRRRREPPGTSA